MPYSLSVSPMCFATGLERVDVLAGKEACPMEDSQITVTVRKPGYNLVRAAAIEGFKEAGRNRCSLCKQMMGDMTNFSEIAGTLRDLGEE